MGHDDCLKSSTAETLNAVTTQSPCDLSHVIDFTLVDLVKHIEDLNAHQEVLAPLLKALARHAHSKLNLPRDVKLTVALKFSQRFPSSSQRKQMYASKENREEVLKKRNIRRKEKAMHRREARKAKKHFALQEMARELRESTEEERSRLLALKLERRRQHHARRNQRAIKTLSRLSKHYLASVPSSVLKYSDDHTVLADAAEALKLPFQRLERERIAAAHRAQEAAARCRREEAARHEEMQRREAADFDYIRKQCYALALRRGYVHGTFAEFVRLRSHLSRKRWEELYYQITKEKFRAYDDYDPY